MTAPGDITEEEPLKEIWVAAGVRIAADGKRSCGWRDPEDGTIRLWGDTTRKVLGGYYQFEVFRHPDGSITRRGDPLYLGEKLDDTGQIAEWEIASESAQRRLAGQAAERRDLRRAGVIDEACAPLMAMAAKCKSFSDVDRLAVSVKQRLYDAWDKGSK